MVNHPLPGEGQRRLRPFKVVPVLRSRPCFAQQARFGRGEPIPSRELALRLGDFGDGLLYDLETFATAKPVQLGFPVQLGLKASGQPARRIRSD